MSLTIQMQRSLLEVLLVVVLECSLVTGHAKMIEPPMRSSMWRFGFNTPVNYNDNELFCGGIQRFMKNDGRCGTCGDPFDDPNPAHEAGGKFATGTIVRYYPQYTRNIPVTIDVTAHHKAHIQSRIQKLGIGASALTIWGSSANMVQNSDNEKILMIVRDDFPCALIGIHGVKSQRGFFEFRLCPHNNIHTRVSQQCLDQNLLIIQEGEHQGHPYRYFPRDNGLWNVTVQIPPGITCTQCVLQMRYKAGNSWGINTKESDKGPCLGCGVQEEFRNCADISIGYPEPPSTTTVTSVPVTSSKPDQSQEKSRDNLSPVNQKNGRRQPHNRYSPHKETNKYYSKVNNGGKDKKVKDVRKDFNYRVRRIEETLMLLDDTERVLSGLQTNFDENPENKKMSGMQYVKIYSGLVWTKRKIRHLEKLINKIVSKLSLIVNTRKNPVGPKDQRVYLSEYESKNSIVKSKVPIESKVQNVPKKFAKGLTSHQMHDKGKVRKQTTVAVTYSRTTRKDSVSDKNPSRAYDNDKKLSRDSGSDRTVSVSTNPVSYKYTHVVLNIKNNVTERPIISNHNYQTRDKHFINWANNNNKSMSRGKKENSGQRASTLANKFPALRSWLYKTTPSIADSKGSQIDSKSKTTPIVAPNAMSWTPDASSRNNSTFLSTSKNLKLTSTNELQTMLVTHPTKKSTLKRATLAPTITSSTSLSSVSRAAAPVTRFSDPNAIKLHKAAISNTVISPENMKKARNSPFLAGNKLNSKLGEKSNTENVKYHTDKTTGFKVADPKIVQKEILPSLGALGLDVSSVTKQRALTAPKPRTLSPRLKAYDKENNYAISKWMRAELRNRILHREYMQTALQKHKKNENSIVSAQ